MTRSCCQAEEKARDTCGTTGLGAREDRSPEQDSPAQPQRRSQCNSSSPGSLTVQTAADQEAQHAVAAKITRSTDVSRDAAHARKRLEADAKATREDHQEAVQRTGAEKHEEPYQIFQAFHADKQATDLSQSLIAAGRGAKKKPFRIANKRARQLPPRETGMRKKH